MSKNRLEAFSDGVLAIIITIMVLELRAPHEASWTALRQLWPVFVSYVISFVYIGIYWNNHHHMMHAVHQVNGAVLWANLVLLFWLSLIPFATGWMGENHFAPLTVTAYGVALLMPALSWTLLTGALVRLHGPDSAIARALGSDVKATISLVAYVSGIVLATFVPAAGLGLYVLVAIMWLVPDRRFEHVAINR